MATKRRMHFTKANAQNGTRSCFWPEFRKTATIRARYIPVPFTVQTREGALDMPYGGWLALDGDGYPYPIETTVFDRTYEQIDDSPTWSPSAIEAEHAAMPEPTDGCSEAATPRQQARREENDGA